MDHGFGTPTVDPLGTPWPNAVGTPPATAQVVNDRGFGSPHMWPNAVGTPPAFVADPDESGFGSPIVVIAPVFVTAENGKLPDDGFWLEVRSAWPSGQLQVQFRDADSTIFPATDEGCWSGIPDQGDAVYANLAGDTIRFALPALAPGIYDMLVRYGPGLGQLTEITGAIHVVRRNRAEAVYRLRAQLSPLYLTGQREVRRERLLV